MRAASWRYGMGLTAVLTAAACGGAEERAPGPVPMGSTARAEEPRSAGLANRPPVVEQVRIRPEAPGPGQTVRAEVEASDPDGDALRLAYAWRLRGAPRPGGRAELVLDGAQKGELVEVRVTASDGRAESAPARASVRVANRAPLLHSVVLEPMGELTSSEDVRARPRAVDPDGDTLEYRFRWWVNGERVEDSGEVLANQRFRRGDEIALEVVASDGESESEPVRSPPLRVRNGSPRITSQPTDVDREGRFHYVLRAKDPDGDTRLRYRLVEGPPGMRVDAVLGVVDWQPAPDASGTHRVAIAVEDFQGGEGIQRFELYVGEESPPASAAE